MIRTSREGASFGLWRKPGPLIDPAALTTARYEPISRFGHGSGHVDLLFERDDASCVVAALRLDPNSLVIRERSPIIWPRHIAGSVEADRLLAIEARIVPWLRALARARPMAQEEIRRFIPSPRFERARAAELLGAAPLELVMRRMAPFVYARRFAAGAQVQLDVVDDALGAAILADIAAGIAFGSTASTPDQAFARDWYGVTTNPPATEPVAALTLVEQLGTHPPGVIVELSPAADSTGAFIDVPTPAPWDVLFSFDPAEAPTQRRFAVHAPEPPLRPAPLAELPQIVGGSAGTIVIALSAEARAMRGADVLEAETLARCLGDEGLTVRIVSDPNDPAFVDAQLVHIVGGTWEPHTVAFAEVAHQRGIDFLFDVPPRAPGLFEGVESMLLLATRAAHDDADYARYFHAYSERRLSGPNITATSADEMLQIERKFNELAVHAVAIVATEEDADSLRLQLPQIAERVSARGVLLEPEPPPLPIGHLIRAESFAFVDAPIAPRSNVLFTALAAEAGGIPLVVAGPVYDVEYLQTLRAAAPNTIIVADAPAGVVSAFARRASLWIDASPRSRTAAGLIRAIRCGQLPAVAAESPLARIAGPDGAAFALTSVDDAAGTFARALVAPDRAARLAALDHRLGPRGNLARSFGGLLTAYARVATVV